MHPFQQRWEYVQKFIDEIQVKEENERKQTAKLFKSAGKVWNEAVIRKCIHWRQMVAHKLKIWKIENYH